MSLCFHYQVQSVLRRTKWLLQNLCKMIDFMKWFHVSTAKSFCQLLIFDTGRIKNVYTALQHETTSLWKIGLLCYEFYDSTLNTLQHLFKFVKSLQILGSPSTLKHLLYYCARNYCTRLQFFDYRTNINYLIIFII